MSGYKYGAQLIAEEIAEERYGKGFYELTDSEQHEVYTAATESYFERHIA